MDRPPPGRHVNAGVDTAVSIEREVVSGHAYAILAPDTVDDGRCGYENPTYLSEDGVFLTRNPWAPARKRRGPRHGGVHGPTR